MKTTASHPFRSARAKAEYTALYEARARAWPVRSETRVVETPAGQTFVRISGREGDPPVVLLHGARGNGLMWVPNIAALTGRYRAYALDTIGETGLSVSRGRLTRREQLVAWLDEVLGALVPEGQVSLVGMSYGGWLASQYALRQPERVRRLVLLAPAATVLPVSAGMLGRALLTVLPGITFRRRFYYWLLHDSVASGEKGRAAVDEAVADWDVAERCFGSLMLVPATVLDDQQLSGLKVPTLYLVGENEKVYPARKAVDRLRRVAPQIRAVVIPGAGHDLWMAQAEAVNEAIVEFLAEG